MKVSGKLWVELIADLDNLRTGIATFPALLSTQPESELQDIHLDHYKIEPLHDFKGHMANLFEEIPHLLRKDSVTAVRKDTLQCVDYRKAAILLSQVLHNTNADETVAKIVDTAVEICEIFYSRDNKQTHCNIL